MLGPFATASRFTLSFTRCRYCRTPQAHRCPRQRRRRQQRQRVKEGTAMAPWNGPNQPFAVRRDLNRLKSHLYIFLTLSPICVDRRVCCRNVCWRNVRIKPVIKSPSAFAWAVRLCCVLIGRSRVKLRRFIAAGLR